MHIVNIWELRKYCYIRTSSADLDKDVSPILFLEIVITSWPHKEKPDTPSEWPLKIVGCGGQFLWEKIIEAIRKGRALEYNIDFERGQLNNYNY